MKIWSAWLTDVQPRTAGCPDPVVEREIMRAAQDFMARSRAWTEILPVFPVAAAQSVVDVTPQDTMLDLVRVDSVAIDGRRIEIATAEGLDFDNGPAWEDATGAPSRYLQLTPGRVRLYPIPTTAASLGLRVRAHVAPSDLATGLPDDLASLYGPDLVNGAIGRLLAMDGEAWAKPKLAAGYLRSFEDAISTARMHAARSYGAGRFKSRPTWC